MLKRLAIGAGVALAAACGPIAVGAGVASAAPPSVTLSGAINCAATGQMKFSQPLTNSNPSAQVTVAVKVKLAKCTGPGTISGPVTLTHGTLVASSTATMLNACGTISSATPLPTMAGTISWKGSKGTITSSAVTVQNATGFYDQGANELHIGLPTSVGTGSYSGQTTTFTGLDSNRSAYLVTSTCSGKKGLKSIAFGRPAGSVTGSLAIVGG
jgi:hypothetical protein